jgi:hypothetical protein
MKKGLMGLIGAMMILSLAACTPTTEKNVTSQVKQEASTKPAETKAKTDKSELSNSVDYDKPAEFNAEVIDVVSIYTVKKDGSGLDCTMESISETEMSAETLADMMIQYGTLEEGTEVLDFTTGDELTNEEAVGPGIAKLPNNLVVGTGISATGVLNLSRIPDDGKDDLVVHAIARTFMENMKVQALTVQLNGETIADSLTADDVE